MNHINSHVPPLGGEDSLHGSPNRGRIRKSRQRRQNSRGTNPFSATSPVKSPTKEALHHELTSKTAALCHEDGTHVSPSSLKTLSKDSNGGCCEQCHRLSPDKKNGPQECPHQRTNARNLNDVCFGCDGRCSDETCSSKRSSRVSADVESNNCTPCTSPSQGLDSSCELARDLRPLSYKGQGQERIIEDDSTNMNIYDQETETIENVEKDPENGNSQSDSPKRDQSRSPKSPRARGGSKRCKRARSMGDGPEDGPNKMAANSNSRGEVVPPTNTGWRRQPPAESCSDDGEVEESAEEDRRR